MMNMVNGRLLTPQEKEDIALGRRNPEVRIATKAEKDKLDEFQDAIRYSSRSVLVRSAASFESWTMKAKGS